MFVKVEFISELLYWIALNFTGVPNKVATECRNYGHLLTNTNSGAPLCSSVVQFSVRVTKQTGNDFQFNKNKETEHLITSQEQMMQK